MKKKTHDILGVQSGSVFLFFSYKSDMNDRLTENTEKTILLLLKSLR